jgi:6-pyruvoyltetrahydropterin/6-carboxytetrahydropterin synthase
MQLTREVRFQIAEAEESTGVVMNSWAGWPGTARVCPFIVIRATVSGEPDPTTGYICDISSIDKAIREKAIPAATKLYTESISNGGPRGEALLHSVLGAIKDRPPAGTSWRRLECRITPFLSFTIQSEDWTMVRFTQSFEFAASHRLHCPELSAEENRRIFGKCNNPNGHGHNYQLDVTVTGGEGGNLVELERAVKKNVIDQFDHKHLNTDCDEFASLNPSVENISKVIWGKLDGQFNRAKLVQVRVWETPKTCADYFGPANQ